jgi:hypothetical protein
MNPYKKQDLNKFIDSFSKEEIERKNREQQEDNEKVYKDFLTNLKNGKCFLCNEKLDDFIVSKPCFHWFTYPKGIKKKYFKNYLKNPIGFFRIDSYFRWLANTEKPLGNINDLKEETSNSSFLETTYKYKNIEWAFSIGKTDIEGHQNSNFGDKPHYHIQMKVDNRIFLKFNDYHIPFTDEDLFTIELFEQAGDRVIKTNSYGHGMSSLEDEGNLEIFDDEMTITDDFDNATINRQTMIQAPEGETISGELIQKALEESRRTKKPIGKIMQRLMKDSKITTVLSPGDGVPKMSKRNGKK